MKHQDFTISTTTIWVLIIANLACIGLGILDKFLEWGLASLFFYAGLLVYFPCWIIILIEMLKKKVYNKWFWVFSMLIMPVIASFFYMLQREKLFRLGGKMDV